MANLIVRDIDESLVRALKQRAAKHGRSAEAEHREILAVVLRGPRKRQLADVLAAVPNVGRDSDFTRSEDAIEAERVPG
jgi:plasmid stability protein